MDELLIEKEMKEWFAPFLECGFSYRYFYEKGGDSSCVYIYRFQKGKDFFDLREVSGGSELNFVVYANGEYAFPPLTKLYAKQWKAFSRSYFLRKIPQKEKRKLFADLLVQHLQANESFFGIKTDNH